MERPDDLISTDKMIPLMADLQILESHYHRMYQRPTAYKQALDSACFYVFENHEVSRDQFEDSFRYYSSDLNSMYAILEASLDTLNARSSMYNVPIQ